MSVMVATILFSATIEAADTGDWNLPGAVAALILFVALFAIFMLIRALFLWVLFFWPVLIAVIVVWAGYRLHFEKSKKSKNEGSSNGEQPGRN